MNLRVADRVWIFLGDRAKAVRADPYLAPAFEAMARGDAGALHAGAAARDFARCARATLNRHAKALLGRGYAHVAMAFRLDAARALLRDPRAPVAVVARAVGFADPTVFCHAYHRHAGLAPRDARDPRRRVGPEGLPGRAAPGPPVPGPGAFVPPDDSSVQVEPSIQLFPLARRARER